MMIADLCFRSTAACKLNSSLLHIHDRIMAWSVVTAAIFLLDRRSAARCWQMDGGSAGSSNGGGSEQAAAGGSQSSQQFIHMASPGIYRTACQNLTFPGSSLPDGLPWPSRLTPARLMPVSRAQTLRIRLCKAALTVRGRAKPTKPSRRSTK